MPTSFRRRVLAATSVLVLTTWGSTATAFADSDKGNNGNGAKGSHGTSTAPGQTKNHPTKKNGNGTSTSPGQTKNHPPKKNGNSGSHGPATAPGQNKGGPGAGTANGDPAGNNGTIKITPIGERDDIPDNNPHVTCGFQIEWYGFDQGDYYSQVSFEMQAPTGDATITPNGPSSVFVGGDPASGAGTATGLDARTTYLPTFTGTPHPKQGFHVKVTVATPFSQGNDSKSKVFWVQPCAGTTPPVVTPPAVDTPDTDTPTGPNVEPVVDVPDVVAGPTRGVEARVPTEIDAGQDGTSVLDRIRSPLPLLIAAVALGGVLLWSRHRARVVN
ncbi:hypothetical protein ABIE44_001941 [Marmoricola sp. OAE513]|uniref:hypothetical protein n=1 Tax=Marmoricola sp. OAE513 TaxID=2817894 RepID=UPI001AE3C75C